MGSAWRCCGSNRCARARLLPQVEPSSSRSDPLGCGWKTTSRLKLIRAGTALPLQGSGVLQPIAITHVPREAGSVNPAARVGRVAARPRYPLSTRCLPLGRASRDRNTIRPDISIEWLGFVQASFKGHVNFYRNERGILNLWPRSRS
jgi:hypothetical protein